MENIEWDKLQTSRTVRVIVEPKYIEKKLPEGVYACPQCDGEEKVMTVHRMFGSHKYGTCGMCRRTGEIRKCTVCNINPVPNIKNQEECIDCFEIKSKRLSEEFMERVNKGEINDNK